MAGFGDIALAFAGGAARQINEDADAIRTSKLRQEERAKQLRMAQRLRVEESMHAAELKRQEQDNQYEREIQSAKSPMLRAIAIAKANGQDIPTLVRLAKAGENIGEMTFTRSTPRARRKIPDYLKSDEKTRVVNSASKIAKLLGSEVDPVDLPEVQAPEGSPNDGRPVTYSTGDVDWRLLGDTEKSRAIPIKNADGTTEIVFIDEAAAREVGTSIKVGEPAADKKEQFTSAGNFISSEGTLVQLQTRGSSYYLGDTKVDITDYTPAVDATAERRSNALSKSLAGIKGEADVAGEVVNAVHQLSKFKTAELGGVPGLATSAEASMYGFVESFTGAKVGKDGIKPTTLAAHMASDFEGGRAAKGFLESRMSQGKSALYETVLLYKAAKMLKPEGKLNVDDIERMAAVINFGQLAGPGEAAVVSGLLEEATARGKSRVAAYLDIKGVEGVKTIKYHPTERVWMYSYIDKDGVLQPKRLY